MGRWLTWPEGDPFWLPAGRKVTCYKFLAEAGGLPLTPADPGPFLSIFSTNDLSLASYYLYCSSQIPFSFFHSFMYNLFFYD